MRVLICITALVLVAALAAGTAYADSWGQAYIKQIAYGYVGFSSVRADFTYDDGGGVPGYDGAPSSTYAHWDENYWSDNVYTGQYGFDLDPAKSSWIANKLLKDPFYAYCTDLVQNPGDWSYYDLRPLEEAPIGGGVGPMGTTKANALRELFGTVKPGILIGNANHEAFAACVWEIVYEKPGVAYNLASGWLQVGALTSGSLAQGWLNGITWNTSEYDNGVFAITSPGKQDFALTNPDLGGYIPEPVTMAGLMLGIGSIAGYARRRRTA